MWSAFSTCNAAIDTMGNNEMMDLIVSKLTVSYLGAGRAVLNNVSFSAPAGQITALVGPSGCGKSTILKSISGIIDTTSGSILVGQKDLTSLTADRRKVGYVPQSYGLFPHMTVVDNVGFGFRFSGLGVSKRTARRLAAPYLELTRVADLSNRFPSQLSGGQRQRVALARAIAFGPEILLLDEPLSALDPELREGLRNELDFIVRSTGLTTVIVTHDQQEAFALADYMVVMKDGCVIQVGSPKSIWQSPTSAFAASFVASAKLLPCTVTNGGIRTLAGDVGFRFLAPGSVGRIQESGPSGVLAISPDSIQLVEQSADTLTGVVTKVQFAASRQHLTIRVADTELATEVAAHIPLCVEEKVGVAFRDHSIHWFPSEGHS
jgi:putative spermidine/putrescine transport system ATP-binding protein